MELQNFIRVYDNVISAESCQRIISDFESHQEFVKNHDSPLYKFQQLDVNQTPNMLGLAQAYVGSLYPCYEDYFKSVGLREYVNLDHWEDVRIKKYVKGSTDEFRTHVDITDHASAARFAIAIMYLNDNDGLTTFPTLGVAVKPQAGRVVIFPPTWMYPHNGLTPSDNDKYIMMTCLHYR
jgi:hypothetical protein